MLINLFENKNTIYFYTNDNNFNDLTLNMGQQSTSMLQYIDKQIVRIYINAVQKVLLVQELIFSSFLLLLSLSLYIYI